MFELYASKVKLTVRKKEQITSGSVNVYPVTFEFSEDWEGLDKVAVFRAGEKTVSIQTDGETTIPWEVLKEPGFVLYAGVYGTKGAEIVLPTIWAQLNRIEVGTAPGDEARPPTPELWEQELAKKGDTLGYTEGGELGLYAGETLLSSVPVQGGAGSFGVGHGLKVVGNDLTVDSVSDFEGDNTLPMTAAGVQTTVGNIEALLATI